MSQTTRIIDVVCPSSCSVGSIPSPPVRTPSTEVPEFENTVSLPTGSPATHKPITDGARAAVRELLRSKMSKEEAATITKFKKEIFEQAIKKLLTGLVKPDSFGKHASMFTNEALELELSRTMRIIGLRVSSETVKRTQENIQNYFQPKQDEKSGQGSGPLAQSQPLKRPSVVQPEKPPSRMNELVLLLSSSTAMPYAVDSPSTSYGSNSTWMSPPVHMHPRSSMESSLPNFRHQGQGPGPRTPPEPEPLSAFFSPPKSKSDHPYVSDDELSATVKKLRAERKQYYVEKAAIEGKLPLKPEGPLPKMAVRPDRGGTQGVPLAVKANHFAMQLSQLPTLFQYDVSIEKTDTDESLKRRMAVLRKGRLRKAVEAERNWKIFCKLKEEGHFAGIPVAYDRAKILIARHRLPIDGVEAVTICVPFNEVDYDFVIKFAGTVDLAPNTSDSWHENLTQRKATPLQAIDLILRQHMLLNEHFEPVGRTFFNKNLKFDLGAGKEGWQGFYCAVHVVQTTGTNGKGVMLTMNVDVTCSGFFKVCSMKEFCEAIVSRGDARSFSVRDWSRVERDIKSLRFTATHLKRADGYRKDMKLKGLVRERDKVLFPSDVKFDYETPSGEMKQISVKQYYKERYPDIQVDDNLPVLWTGTKQRPSFHPMSLFTVAPSQRVPNSRLGPKDLTSFRDRAGKPDQRMRNIENEVRHTKIGQDDISRAFGLALNSTPMQFNARVLNAPAIEYRYSERPEYPQRGAWRQEQHRFVKCVSIREWGVVCIGNPREIREDQVQNFAEILAYRGCDHGIDFPRQGRVEIKYVSGGADNLTQCFVYFQKMFPRLDILLVIVPDKTESNGMINYDTVKTVAETQMGIITQCVQRSNMNKCSRSNDSRTKQTLSNICSKINTKLGGVNCFVSAKSFAGNFLHKNRVLFLGGDITHPSPGKDAPSIAAICSNVDTPPFQYVGQHQPQKGRLDVINDFSVYIERSIEAYRKNTGHLPEHIIYYRDGVSEGQYLEVLQQELAEMKKGIESVARDKKIKSETYRPPITVISCQKRHHSRFITTAGNLNTRPGDSIPPGTVIDTHIVHPMHFDFYLCSHQGIQGTSKPCHYVVMHDDNNFSSDEIQAITWELCHMYAKCARSVSIPPPVYNAHNYAFRCRSYLKDAMSNPFSDVMSVCSGDSTEKIRAQEEAIAQLKEASKIHRDIRSKFFFS